VSMKAARHATSEETRTSFESLGDMVTAMADTIAPPERLSPSEVAAKYRMLQIPGAYSGPYLGDTTPYMAEPLDCIADPTIRSIVFVGGAQCGKALAVDTPILTFKGWSTMGDLRPGQAVYDENGMPTTVVGVSPVMVGRVCYEVAFDDDSRIIADADHLWTVDDDKKKGKSRTITTDEIASDFRFRDIRFRFAIPNTKPVYFPEKSLQIPPYLLGVWLGDGHSRSAKLSLNKLDADISARIASLGYEVRHYADNNAGGFIASVGSGFQTALKALGLHNSVGQKHIPPDYLRASVAQRMELLRGLMDTDGCAEKRGRCTFSTSEEAIRDGFAELLSSLGFKFNLRSRIPTYEYLGEKLKGKLAHEFSFVSYAERPCFHTSRKKNRLTLREDGRPTHTERRRITDVRLVESVPVRCIKVANPTGLFLAGRNLVPTHNTDSLILNAMLYTIIADPIDTILYQTSQTSAADFSRTRLDRMHRHSPESGARLLPGGNDDTVHAKYYKSGIVINLSWPTINEMSGKPRGRVLLTDYDRMPQDIDGEGSPFDLAQKRTTSFRSKAKTIVESSPGFEVPAGSLWAPKTPHEAPPCGGILALYNRGDKRRYQWQCPDCRAWFEPVFDLLRYNAELPPGEAGKTAQMGCPHCGVLHGPERKYDLNRAGRWVKDGQRLLEDGTLVGEAPANSCASFWLMGAAAAFLPWADLVAKYLTAEEEYRRTGSQEALKTTVNTDQSMPYRRRGKTVDRLPEELRSRADTWLKGTVPADVRFLVATADVQGKKFVVQVHGIAPGSPYTVVVIDRFDISKSERRDADGERMPLEPAAYPEDWRLLDEVVEREYPLESGAGHMRIKMLACDSGGQEGTTTRAYGYWLDLRREGSGLHRRFQLLKGDATPAAPRARIGYPDASKRDKNSPLRGDVPVLFLASNVLKDTLDGMLNRPDAIRFPEWMTDEFFMEMCVEVRTEKGWQNPHRRRNETWDLLYYCLGLCVHLGVEHIDWSAPPGWASPQAENPLVRIQANAPAKFAASTTPTRDLRALARALAG
jgi:phage terminase large subunit GpA-like protein